MDAEPAVTASKQPITLDAFFTAQVGALPTEDVLHVMLPLMRSVAALHERGRVALLGLHDVAETSEGAFAIVRNDGQSPKSNQSALQRVQPQSNSGLKIVGEYRVTNDEGAGTKVEDLRAESGEENDISKPVYLTDLRCWEHELGHHDEITDVFQIGMIMACVGCGLNPRDADDVERFSFNRTNLFVIQPRLHPVLASIILEATALNRHERATDLASLAKRLETYRDQPIGLEVERVLAGASGIPGRRSAVLSHLRDRLFDLSRRNRLIYFKPTQSSVNLTEASVPIVLRLESVRSDQLCTWGGRFVSDVLSGKSVPLTKWLRFEDQPHLPSAFDRIIQETRRDRAEFGFSHLRLVIGFLRWHNLKEAPEERIVSPLLWLPVEVTKAKGVRDQYTLRSPEPIAEFNPALRHMLRQLYDIKLPETVDLTTVSLTELHADLMQQIHKTEPGVRLELQHRPQIRLIFQKAVQRIKQFTRRRGLQKEKVNASTDFSYARDDYRPLGFALFEKFVKPSPLPQRLAAGGSLKPRPEFMVAETEALTFEQDVDEGHRFSWEIDLTQVTLANFNYKKMSLVRDFAELIDRPESQPAFDQIFSIEPRAFVQDAPPPIPANEQWNVVASDATQDAAVALSRTGRSFIIQGPPGTGKSQTITNLIADYAARGKRVLFVCEKRAALDVVFHRLGQAGLDGLSCIIHDSQEDKKGFIHDLKAQYGKWGKGDDRLAQFQTVRTKTVSALDQHLGSIAAYDMAVGAKGSVSLRSIVRRAAALPATETEFGPSVRERLPDLNSWDANRLVAERAVRASKDSLGLPNLASHPFAMLGSQVVNSERPFALVETMINTADGLLTRLDGWLNGGSSCVTSSTLIAAAKEATELAGQLRDTCLGGVLSLLEASSPASLDLQQSLAKIDRLKAEFANVSESAGNWTDPLSPEDTAQALEQAQQQEGSFFRFLSGKWRALRKTVHQRYEFSAHAVTPTITTVLEKLQAVHIAEAGLRGEWQQISDGFGTTDLDAFLRLRDRLLGDGGLTPATAKMIDVAKSSTQPLAAIGQEAAQAAAIGQLIDTVSKCADGTERFTFDQLAEMLRDMREGLEDLPEILPILADIHAADPNFSFALRSIPLPLPGLEALVVDEAISRLERANPEIRSFDIERMIAVTRRAARARELLRGENADAICATLHRNFRDHVKTSETSVTMLDSEGKRFKKRYATGRRELEHEFGKTMRYRSIRDMASGDTGLVVNDLKPIWLMSPLSVSDTLPLEPDLFDVVIFDEASQIPTEEAVPALCRSNQVIIVGDEMQLPPTSFFSTTIDEDDMQIEAEEDGETIAIILDADSLLNQSARNLPATLLAWHYRSRFESLISFSNAAFYNGQLVTIPDQSLRATEASNDPVKSDDTNAWKSGVDRLLHYPITTHRIGDGLYEKRTNLPEARYIAGLVREILLRDTGQSIGIAAFSEAQQSEIENALDRLGSEDSAFAAALEREYIREDDGQFNGLFVKNLENVQGDERDIILMSVCYAPGKDGRMVMNFGPINQRGGEKRLNVIFSRARRHMAIVSTIAPEAITNIHNDGARALRSFLSFAEAQSSGAQDHAQAVLSALNPDAAKTFGADVPVDPVRTAIAEALRERGHIVHEHVGGASFRCDLAIVNAVGDGYSLGILLDRDTDSGISVEERFLFRPTILRSFGWRVIDIPVAAWLRARDATVERIVVEISNDSWDQLDSDPFAGVTLPKDVRAASPSQFPQPVSALNPLSPVKVPEDTVARSVSEAIDANTPPMIEFRFVQGTSNKYWKVGLNGCDLIVQFGRVGTKGQRVIKTFDDEDRAKREAIKLTLEKTRKGYEEFG
jgi:predicted DNA-binding WGR domain protein